MKNEIVKVKDERERILKLMAEIDPADERYKVLEERLNQLKDDRIKFDKNGAIQCGIKAAGPIVLGLIIVSFEKVGGAFISQASKFIKF